MAFQPQLADNLASGRWVRARYSLTLHWLLASLVLLGLLPIIGAADVWSADVGAQLAQSQQLATGGGWYFSHPLPQADPSGEWFTYHLSGRVDGDYVVLAKHPAFSWLVAGLLQLGGFGAVLAFSALSTSTAGFGVAFLARMTVDERSAVVLLWIVAVMSPLAFDGYLGYAHTFAAALIIWSMYAAVLHIRSGRIFHQGVLLSCVLAAIGPFVRTEAVLAGVALGLALITTSRTWWTVTQRRVALISGSLVVVSALIGFVGDRLISIQADSYIGQTTESVGWLTGRFLGFNATWLWASSSGWRTQDILLIAVPILWYLGGRAAARSSEQSHRYLIVGAGLMVLWWLLDPQHVVPGLLLAFPLLTLLASLITIDFLDTPVQVLGLAAFAFFAGAVILTQYPQGGTAEWGGRYFAAGIPFVMVGVSSSVKRLINPSAQRLSRTVLPVGIASVLLISTGFGALRQSRLLVADLGASVEQTIAGTEQSYGNDDVVVISTSNAVSRLLWAQTSTEPWLLVPPEELEEAMANLNTIGVDRVVVIAERHQETNRTIGPYVDVEVVEPWATSPVEILAFHAE